MTASSLTNSKKIDKLTAEQIQLMHEHREQYIDFIVNNKKYYDPAFSNQIKLHIYRQVNPMKDDIDWIYAKAGLKPPTFVFEADSYLQEKMMVSFIRTYTNLDDESCVDEIGKMFGGELSFESSIRNEGWKQIGENVGDNYDNVRELAVSLDRPNKSFWGIQNQVCEDFIQRNNENKEISDTVKAHYEKFDSVDARHQVARQLFNNLTNGKTPFTTSEDQAELNRILNAMRALLDKDLDSSKEKEKDESAKLKFVEQGFGLPWNSWMAFYSYFSRINVLNNKDFDRFFAFFLNHKIWSIQFFKHWVCFTRLPNRIYRDAQNRLHNTDGSCVDWRGRSQDVNYFIHGVPFNEPGLWERVVTNKIPTKEVLSLSNMELRNAVLSVISPAKLISDTNAKLIDEYKTKPRKSMDKYTKNTEKMKFEWIKLYKLDPQEVGLSRANNNNGNGGIYVVFYNCPSTNRDYFGYVDPAKATDAVTALSSKFGLTKKQYLENIVAES
jgi:hypothetical protein